ncbi:MAG: helix-turn-helix domain-containing protein, partial [Acidimicrobiales bacterium]
DDFDAARLAELAGAAVSSARTACAPVFGGWRALPVPTDPKAAAVHQMNGLRELRLGLHAAAVVSAGLTPLQALSVKTPAMAPLFGWTTLADTDGLLERWEGAEERTTVAIAHAYDALDDGERAELAELAVSLHQATKS